MNNFRNILFIISLMIISCKEAENKIDTNNQDIYNFMKIVIEEQNLDLHYGIRLEPESNFMISESDSTVFNKLLFKIKNKQQETKGFNKNDTVISLYNSISLYNESIKEEDISEMILQKKNLKSFQWDNSKLGFNLSNKENWYSFSIPLFSKDKNKAVMKIRDLCSGLCGNGRTILFVKENNNWNSSIKETWFH